MRAGILDRPYPSQHNPSASTGDPMSSARLVRAAATLAGALAIVLAACGPAASAVPTTGAVGTGPPATQAPSATGPAQTDPFGLPSFALPSFTSDADLEALLPDELGGAPVQKFSMTGDSFLGTGGIGADELDDVLSQFGRTPADLSVAFGNAGSVTILAYRIRDVPAEMFYQGFLAAAQQDAEVTVTDASVGGKSVKRVVSSDSDIGTSYVYARGDVLFVVGGDGVSDALLDETFSKLP